MLGHFGSAINGWRWIAGVETGLMFGYDSNHSSGPWNILRPDLPTIKPMERLEMNYDYQMHRPIIYFDIVGGNRTTPRV